MDEHSAPTSNKLQSIVSGRTRNYKKIYMDVIDEREKEYEAVLARKKLEKKNNCDTTNSRMRIKKKRYK